MTVPPPGDRRAVAHGYSRLIISCLIVHLWYSGRMDKTSGPHPANENVNPFLRTDTALRELYRLRSEVLGRNTAHHSFFLWRLRREALKELDARSASAWKCFDRRGNPLCRAPGRGYAERGWLARRIRRR